MKDKISFISAGLAMIITGLIYTVAFEYIEQEVRQMGLVAIAIGFVLTAFSPFYKKKNIKYLAVFSYSLIALIQFLPILLWSQDFTVTDSPVSLHGNIFYTIPHFLIFLTCVWAVVSLLRNN